MKSILVLVLTLNAIQCLDICSFLKPSGKYVGTGVYKYYYNHSSGGYYIFNTNGTELRFDFDGYTAIETNETQNFNPMIVKRFGVYFRFRLISGFISGFNNCFIKQSVKLLTI